MGPPPPSVLHVEAAPLDRAGAAGALPPERALAAVEDQLAAAERRSVLLHGTGAGFMVAGALADAGSRRMLARVCAAIADHPLPVIAAVDAPLHDAGLELTLACDLRYVRRGATVGFPAAARGRLPGGGAQRLVRLAGSGLAARMLLLGETPAAGDEPLLGRALSVADDPASAAAAALAALEARGPLALEALKVALRTAEEVPLSAGAAIEADLACLLLDTEDRAEGLDAFRDRRPPAFRDR